MATLFYCRMMSQFALVGLSTFVWAGPTLGDLQDTVPLSMCGIWLGSR